MADQIDIIKDSYDSIMKESNLEDKFLKYTEVINNC